MEIKSGKFVEATYDLFVGGDENELMEQATTSNPLRFVFGANQMLESFEKQLQGLKDGDSFDFTISSENAYGERNEEHVLELGKDMFEVDGVFDEDMIFEGNTVPMMDSNGNRLNGSVLEVKGDVVVMDFNHPLAGEDLHFVGKVVTVRDATPEELNPQAGCGGGCGGSCDCGDDGCSDEGCSDGRCEGCH